MAAPYSLTTWPSATAPMTSDVTSKDALSPDEVIEVFDHCGALLKGHFILTSGLHSETYLNKSIVSKFPQLVTPLCRALAFKAREALAAPAMRDAPDARCVPRAGDGPIDYVIAPAMGGIIYGYESARALGVPFMYTERVNGKFELRRGFAVEKGARILIVEDIISTGLSARECVATVKEAGGDVVAVGCLIDRSGGQSGLELPVIALASLDIPTYRADALPPHLAGVPAIKPGSRGLA